LTRCVFLDGCCHLQLVHYTNSAFMSVCKRAVKYPPSDLYHDVTALCYKLWQADWDQRTGNKLHSVKPHLRYYPLSSLSCRDTVVLRRLHIGHTRLSHSYLLSREDQPLCSSCGCVLTIVHLLIECPLYTTVRRKYFSVLSMAELFDTTKATNIHRGP